jgi:hypothetical protein
VTATTTVTASDWTIAASIGLLFTTLIGWVSWRVTATAKRSQDAFRARLDAIHERNRPRPAVHRIPVRPFTAVSDCPRCGSIYIHPLREARPADMAPQPFGIGTIHTVEPLTDDEAAELASQEIRVMRAEKHALTRTVVRQCKCGQEWRET